MKNKILLLTDFSECAKNAALYALHAFPPEDYDYILLHVNPRIAVPGDIKTSISEEMRKEAMHALEREEMFFRRRLRNNTTFEKLTYLGFLNEAVNAISREKNPDLVVMGTQGETGLPSIVIGSHASSLIKAISLPLLIIPEKAKFTGLKHLVLAADPRTIQKPEHLEPITEIVDLFGSQVTVINITKRSYDGPDTFSLEEAIPLREALSTHSLSLEHLEDESTVHGITQYVHENPCDLLVVIERSRTFVVDLFHRSVTKNLALHTETPLLVLHG